MSSFTARAALLANGLVAGADTVLPASSPSFVMSGLFQTSSQLITLNNISSVLKASMQMLEFPIFGPQSTGYNFDVLNKLELEVTVQNTDGANTMSYLNMFNMLQRVELVINGTSVKEFNNCPMTIESLFHAVCPQREFIATAAQMGYGDAVFSTNGTPIPAASEQVFRLNLTHLFSELTAGYPCVMVTDKVSLRVYFNPGAEWLISTSAANTADINVSNVQCIAHGQKLTPPALSDLIASTAGKLLSIPCVLSIFYDYNLGAISAAGSGRIPIQFAGPILGFQQWLYGAGSPTTPEGRYTGLSSYGEFFFYNSTGTLLNTVNTTKSQLKQLEAILWGPALTVYPTQTATTDPYPDRGPIMPFCMHPVGGLRNVSRHGSYLCNGQEQFSIKPPAGSTYASLRVLACYWTLGTFIINPSGSVVCQQLAFR